MKDTKLEEIDKAAKEAAHYLYVIEDSTVIGDIDPLLYEAIGTLRQLINEEFKPAKSLSSQFIYNILNLKLQKLITTKCQEARIEATEKENLRWVALAQAHRPYCSPAGNKMLTRMMGRKNRELKAQLKQGEVQ